MPEINIIGVELPEQELQKRIAAAWPKFEMVLKAFQAETGIGISAIDFCFYDPSLGDYKYGFFAPGEQGKTTTNIYRPFERDPDILVAEELKP